MAQIILVASGKGGSGKSSLVAGLGAALKRLGKKVLAIDCDAGLSSLDILFGVCEKVVFDWGDVLFNRCERERAIIKNPLFPDLIPAPGLFCDGIAPEAAGRLFKSYSEDYDYVLIDSPAGVGLGLRLAAAAAEKALLAATPDEVCVRSCLRTSEELFRLGLTELRLVINMFEVKPVCKRRLLNVDRCVDAVGVQLIGVVPRDPDVSFFSSTGELPGEFSPAVLAYFRIARRLLGERVPLVCE